MTQHPKTWRRPVRAALAVVVLAAIVALALSLVPVAARADEDGLRPKLVLPGANSVWQAPEKDMVLASSYASSSPLTPMTTAFKLPELTVIRTLVFPPDGEMRVECPAGAEIGGGPVTVFFQNSSCGTCSSIHKTPASGDELENDAPAILAALTTTARATEGGGSIVGYDVERVHLANHTTRSYVRHRGDWVLLARDFTDYSVQLYDIFRESTNTLARVPLDGLESPDFSRGLCSDPERDSVFFHVADGENGYIVEHSFANGFRRSQANTGSTEVSSELHPTDDPNFLLLWLGHRLLSYDKSKDAITPFDLKLDGYGDRFVTGDHVVLARPLGIEESPDFVPDAKWNYEIQGWRLDHATATAQPLFHHRLAPDAKFQGFQFACYVAEHDLYFFIGFPADGGPSGLYVVDFSAAATSDIGSEPKSAETPNAAIR